MESSSIRRALHRADILTKRRAESHRATEGRVWIISRAIWPWRDSWLFPLVSLLAALDHLSTFLLLELSGNKAYVYESGPLASWALQRGGWNGLYIMDAVAVGLLCTIAATVRLFYTRVGLAGYARTAYVAVLVPYAVAALVAVVNNLALTFI